jgi:hypothetical protein
MAYNMQNLSSANQQAASSVVNVLSSIYFLMGSETLEFSGKHQDTSMMTLASVKTVDKLHTAGDSS